MANASRGSRLKPIVFDRHQLRQEICLSLRAAMESLRAFKAESRKCGESLQEDIEPQIQEALRKLEGDILNSVQSN